MFKHVGISVNDKSDIDDFYIKILGFKILYAFEIDKNTASEIFNVSQNLDVITLELEDFILEVFISRETSKCTFNHICLELSDFDELMKRIEKHVIFKRINREGGRTIFVRDKSANLFEIKEKK